MHSHSATSTFNNCPWKHRLQQLGYKALREDARSNKKVWGIALHAGLRVLHTGGLHVDAMHAFLNSYPEDLDPSDRAWSIESGGITLARYVERWEAEEGNWEVLESEFHNPEDEREDEGHLVIDLVMRHRASGSIYFWDHKCKTKWDGSGKQYELDAQLTRYTAYVKEHWGDCAGALVNVIVPHYRERKWKDRPAGWDIQFDRKLYSRTPEQIEAWRASQAEWERLIMRCDIDEIWPKHYGSLCSYCEMFDGCYAHSQGAGMEVFEALYRPGVDASQVTIELEED